MRSRHKWSYWDYFADCQTCDWELASKNALGVAAQHFERTGHSVTITVSGGISYLNDEDNAARVTERANR